MTELIEYRVRPVTRYIVTRFEDKDAGNRAPHNVACSRQIGPEYATEEVAYQVGYALALKERDDLGWPAFDERMRFPLNPSMKDAVLVSD